jgi:hypothetical protein
VSAKKLEKNGLFESSRMMLFEHKDQILARQDAVRLFPRPELDEQAAEDMFRLIRESLEERREIGLTVYDSGTFVDVAGYVQLIDMNFRRIKFIHDFQRTWIRFQDVVEVRV